jgi:hypothetical protein
MSADWPERKEKQAGPDDRALSFLHRAKCVSKAGRGLLRMAGLGGLRHPAHDSLYNGLV